MATKVGVGFSEKSESKEAGIEATKAAIAEAGITNPDLVMIFGTAKHSFSALHQGIREVVGPKSQIVGGGAIGVITKDKLKYMGTEVGVAVFSSDKIKFDLITQGGLIEDEQAAGMAFGEKLKSGKFKGDSNLFLIFDAVKKKVEQGFSFNRATPFLHGLGKVLPQWPAMTGVGLAGDFAGTITEQIFNDQMVRGNAVGVILSGGVQLDSVIMHGCVPSSDYHTVTKSEGQVIYEIDGRKATDIVGELLGKDTGWENFPFYVNLGINKGDKFDDYNEDNYQNRMTMAVNKDIGALIMFQDDLVPGTEFQFMRRNLDFKYMEQRISSLLDRIKGRKPVFAFYTDCAGRCGAVCGSQEEDASWVQKLIGTKMPLFGVYSGIEFAQVGKNVEALNITGVLSIFSEA